MEWVRIVSWHAVLTPTRVPETYRTRCGRTVRNAETSDDLPAGKSCETCLRIVARQADKATG